MRTPLTHADFEHRRQQDAFRQGIINDAITALTSSDENRLKQMVHDIVAEHVKLTGTDGFYHNGQVFTNTTGVPFKSLQKQPIHPSLKGRAAEYQKQCRELDSDKAKIGQGLAVLIRNCIDTQGVRNALPDVLIAILPDPRFKHVQRTLPEGHTLTSKLHIAQYDKTMDKVFFYLGSRLLG